MRYSDPSVGATTVIDLLQDLFTANVRLAMTNGERSIGWDSYCYKNRRGTAKAAL
jgi:hypothetical protein